MKTVVQNFTQTQYYAIDSLCSLLSYPYIQYNSTEVKALHSMIDYIRNRTFQWVSFCYYANQGSANNPLFSAALMQLAEISNPVQISTAMDLQIVCTMVQANKLANAVDVALSSYGEAESKSWNYARLQNVLNMMQSESRVRSWLQVHFSSAVQ